MKHFQQYAQVGLLIQYIGLTVVFGLNKKTWPVALYYGGCFVKDSGVYLLAWLDGLFK